MLYKYKWELETQAECWFPRRNKETDKLDHRAKQTLGVLSVIPVPLNVLDLNQSFGEPQEANLKDHN